MSPETARTLAAVAYARGWSDACDDHMAQGIDPQHPIGQSRFESVGHLLSALDPNDLLGLRGGS